MSVSSNANSGRCGSTALGSAGRVARRPGAPGDRQVYWTYLCDTRAQWEIAELVALLALDAGSNP